MLINSHILPILAEPDSEAEAAFAGNILLAALVARSRDEPLMVSLTLKDYLALPQRSLRGNTGAQLCEFLNGLFAESAQVISFMHHPQPKEALHGQFMVVVG